MNNIEIYTKKNCPYCNRAKKLLIKKSLNFVEIPIDTDDNVRAAMKKRSGGRITVPQIFINDIHVGGSDDLHSLNNQGKLEHLLKNVKN